MKPCQGIYFGPNRPHPVAGGWDSRQNALRHSFGTYKTALSGDISRTALEMGNSAGIIVRHYLQLATKEQAKRFFGIVPAQPAKVIRSRPRQSESEAELHLTGLQFGE